MSENQSPHDPEQWQQPADPYGQQPADPYVQQPHDPYAAPEQNPYVQQPQNPFGQEPPQGPYAQQPHGAYGQQQGQYSQQPQQNLYGQQQPPYAYGYAPPGYSLKSKTAAGLLGIFLGAFGVHNFYLGNTGKAVAQLLISILSLGFLAVVSSVWGLIEGILILMSTPGTPWHKDAAGLELRD